VQSALWHPNALGLNPEGNLFRAAHLLRRDDEAWAAYHDLNCLSDYLLELRTREHPGVARELNGQTVQPALTDVSPLYRRLLRGLDAALDAFDTAASPRCAARWPASIARCARPPRTAGLR
jgi:alpha-mannosidase